MTPQQFITQFRAAFGEAAPLPVALWYDDTAVAADTVVTPFASGCASVVTFATAEHRKGGKRCFLGMFDLSARPLVPQNELSFAVPMSRFVEMLRTMPDSALYQKAFPVVRRRINGEIGHKTENH